MKKTNTSEIFRIIKNKLIGTDCNSYLADTLAEDIYCHMYNNKRFIIGYGRLFVKKNGSSNFIVNFNCEFLFPDTGDKVTARFFFKSQMKNHRLHTKGQFRNIDYPIGSEVYSLA